MNGFSAEEFDPNDPSASGNTGKDNTAKPNGHDSGGSTTNGSATGNTSENSGTTGGAAPAAPAVSEPWPELDAAAYHGVAGEIVCLMAPQTEADPVALLLQLLIYTGNALNRGPYVLVGKDRHHTNLFGLLVGDTAKARKGLSAGHVRDCCKDVDPEWADHRIRGGMSSGEGIIHHIRDEVKKYSLKAKEMVTVDPGIADKRLMLDEREFFSALTVMKREGNTLSGVIRDAWDCRHVLETLTKKEPTKASLPFVSITAHITGDELKNSLDHTSMANGYANRFLFACVRRSKMLPFGGEEVDLEEQISQLRTAVETARMVERVTMNEAAKAFWCEIYSELSTGQPGMLGAITARSEAQTLRLSLIYALLDGVQEIDRVHIEAGLALWKYCNASVRFIFGDMLGDAIADAILKALREKGTSGMTRNDILDLFGRNRGSEKILSALELLLTAGKARFEKTATPGRRGRPKETWYAI